MLVRRELFERLGGFNEQELAINFNDVDFCLRARQLGYAVVWTPYANLTHHESASRGHHKEPAEQERFRREVTHFQNAWSAALLHDPFYNPNLSLNLPGFELAFPPLYR
jgi:GT2 family glycosyltransferase